MERRAVFTSILLIMMFNLSVLKQGLAKGQDPTEPLHQAAEVGDVNQVQRLLSKGADVNAIDRAGFTPLFYAAHKGHGQVAEILIAGGANVNAKDSYDNTPLHYAAMAGYYDVCKLFIAKGADVNARNLTGGTPLAMAKAAGHSQVIELLSTNTVATRAAKPTGSRPGLTVTPGAEPTTEPDPIADPNAVRARLKEFKGLEQALDQVDKRSRQYEVPEWLDKRGDNKAKLANAVHRQARAEFAVIRNFAVEDNAKKTTAVIDSILASKQQRYTKLIELVEEQLKDRGPIRSTPGRSRSRDYSPRERSGPDQRTVERVPRGGLTRSIDDPNILRVPAKPVIGLEKELEALAKRSENEMQQWLASGNDARINLANAVQEQIKAELLLTRKVAIQERAKKTTAAIDGLLLCRQTRLARLVEKMGQEHPRQSQPRR